MYQQRFSVLLEGQQISTEVTADQRDLAQMELQPWHGEGLSLDEQGRQVGPRRVHTGMRFLAYSALRRQDRIGPVDWETFNTRLCIDVEALDDEDEQAPDADPNPRGPETSFAGSWSSSPS